MHLVSLYFSRSRPLWPQASFPTRRSSDLGEARRQPRLTGKRLPAGVGRIPSAVAACGCAHFPPLPGGERGERSEEHTSELQSRGHLVCRLLLEKKKRKNKREDTRTRITDL